MSKRNQQDRFEARLATTIQKALRLGGLRVSRRKLCGCCRTLVVVLPGTNAAAEVNVTKVWK